MQPWAPSFDLSKAIIWNAKLSIDDLFYLDLDFNNASIIYNISKHVLSFSIYINTYTNTADNKLTSEGSTTAVFPLPKVLLKDEAIDNPPAPPPTTTNWYDNFEWLTVLVLKARLVFASRISFCRPNILFLTQCFLIKRSFYEVAWFSNTHVDWLKWLGHVLLAEVDGTEVVIG